MHYSNKWNTEFFKSVNLLSPVNSTVPCSQFQKCTPPHWDGWMLLTAFLVITLRKSTHIIWWAQDRCWVGNFTKEEFPHLKHPWHFWHRATSKREIAIILFTKVWEDIQRGYCPSQIARRTYYLSITGNLPLSKKVSHYQLNIQIKLAIILNNLLCLKVILSLEIITINIITPGTGLNTQNILY